MLHKIILGAHHSCLDIETGPPEREYLIETWTTPTKQNFGNNSRTLTNEKDEYNQLRNTMTEAGIWANLGR